MDNREYSEEVYGTKDLVQMICVGPVYGLGCGRVWVPAQKITSCPYCKGYVDTEEHFMEIINGNPSLHRNRQRSE